MKFGTWLIRATKDESDRDIALILDERASGFYDSILFDKGAMFDYVPKPKYWDKKNKQWVVEHDVVPLNKEGTREEYEPHWFLDNFEPRSRWRRYIPTRMQRQQAIEAIFIGYNHYVKDLPV
jgi:hypothetical protein